MRRRRPAPDPGPPTGLRASRLSVGGEDLAVLSFDSPAPRIPTSLTPAERDVLLRVLAGESNREIAAARGSSTSTVANQVAAVFRKLGVRSRAQLTRKLTSR